MSGPITRLPSVGQKYALQGAEIAGGWPRTSPRPLILQGGACEAPLDLAQGIAAPRTAQPLLSFRIRDILCLIKDFTVLGRSLRERTPRWRPQGGLVVPRPSFAAIRHALEHTRCQRYIGRVVGCEAEALGTLCLTTRAPLFTQTSEDTASQRHDQEYKKPIITLC